jgi:hypothetical protein
MGVSHNQRYKVTQHAKDRYLERIDNNTNERNMLKEFDGILRNARFLAKERQGRESWFCEKRDVVIIIDPKKYSVITIYNSVEQYDSAEQEITDSKDIHPKVKEIISNASKQAYTQQEKAYFAKLAPMYKEYGDRIDKLSRTKNTEYFENKKIELNELQAEVSRVVTEKNRVLKDLKTFIKE